MVFLVSLFFDLLARVTRPWRQLFWLVLHLYVSVCNIVLNRVLGAFSRSIEVVTAYRRVKELESLLSLLGRNYEEEKLRNRELQRKLDAFTKDRRRITESLDTVTVERKKAVDTIRFLKNKVQELEFLNQQLAENEEAQRRGLENTVAALTAATKRLSEKKSLGQDSILSSEHENIVQAKDLASKTFHDVLLKDSYLESCDDKQPLMARGGSSPMQVGLNATEVLLFAESEKGVAFVSSIFSAFLSTLVAMIVWEAKDPCTPLVLALVTVVGVSLSIVVRFFSKLQGHEGFVAAALLSLNWFVLGTLAHPALPYLGQLGTGFLYFLSDRFLRFLGFGNVLKAIKVASHESFELY